MGQEFSSLDLSAPDIISENSSGEPGTIKTITRTITRDDVMDEMKPILRRLSDDEWTPELSADISAVLTPYKLKVMPPRSKTVLAKWINEQEDQKYLQWLKNASDDLLSVTWSETKWIPGVKVWSRWHPANLFLNMLEEEADDFSPEQKKLVQDHVKDVKRSLQREKEREPEQFEQLATSVLKAIEKMEDKMTERLDAVQDEVR
jgi:hypothetical protein